jgi:hypothetical protein
VKEPLRIELPDERLARSLQEHLRLFDVDTAPVDGHFEVMVELHTFNPEQRVVDALSALDAWLPTVAVPAVRVHLDGTSYTLHAPRPD